MRLKSVLTALIVTATGLAGPGLWPAPAGAQTGGQTGAGAGTGVGAIDHAALRDRALGVIETQFAGFDAAAGALAQAAPAFCDGTLDRAGFLAAHADAWRAWAPLDAYQFGPVEQRAAVLTIAFWPDKKDYVGRGLDALLTLPVDRLSDPDTIAKASAAAQGLPAMERLLFTDMDACPAVIGIARHVARMAALLHDDWFAPGGWADLIRDAGPGNPVYRSEAEVTKALYTAVGYELEVITDARLGRPLGTFDAPRGTWAEAWRSGLSLDIIDAGLAGVAALIAEGFDGAVPGAARANVLDAIANARARIAELGAPLDEAVADPMVRIRVEGLQTQLRHVKLLLANEVGPALGVDSGFSPADGD